MAMLAQTQAMPMSITDRSAARLPDVWLAALGVALAGYALFGKGFAYLGVPPLFVGELLVASGAVCLLLERGWRRVLALPPILALLAFMGWGLLLTVRDAPAYGLDALRDAVLWGYGAIAVVVATLVLSQPQRIDVAVQRYVRFAGWSVVAIPALWAVQQLAGDGLPTWPWADVTLIYLKGGDSLVHLAGALALWMLGMARPAWWKLMLFTAAVGLIGAVNRGGLLCVMFVGGVAFVLRPRGGAGWRLAAVAMLAMAVIAVADVSFRVPGRQREVSTAQLVENVVSIVSSEHGTTGDLQDTKAWRLAWWGDIIEYTVYGEHFWTGKGFGINLADDDGYQVEEDSSLRSPHNGHMTILARMGVPGLVLWGAALAAWVLPLADMARLSGRRGDALWNRVSLFVLLLGGALLINASFDVFLEGPMGGIWFWSVFGVGAALPAVYRRWRLGVEVLGH